MDPAWVYNETVKMFAIGGDPPHEDPAEMEATWGRVWGLSNDVGRIRTVLMHRPGPEMGIVDPCKVTRSALQNAASIAGLVLTTHCMIARLPEPREPHPGPHPEGDLE